MLKWSQKPSPPAKVCSRTIWRYTHANFEKANQLISDFDWSFLEQETDVDTAWNKWEQTFITIMENCIPKVSISNLPWMNYAIKRKIRKRNHVYRKAKKTGSKSLIMSYRKLRNEIVKLMRQSKKDHLLKMATQGKKQFWKTIKFLNDKGQMPTLKTESLSASANNEKASLLNNAFSQNFNLLYPSLSNEECKDLYLCVMKFSVRRRKSLTSLKILIHPKPPDQMESQEECSKCKKERPAVVANQLSLRRNSWRR